MEYDPRTAVIVVDVQNDFASMDGSLPVAGAEEVIPFINTEMHEAAAAGATIVLTQDWHPPSTPHFAKDGGVWPVHCVAGTAGADLHPNLDPATGAITVRKGVGGEDGYSAFTLRDPESGIETGTGLLETLRDRAIERVVVMGLALDYCVKATAIDAAVAGFATVVAADATRAVNLRPGDGARAVVELLAAGVTVS